MQNKDIAIIALNYARKVKNTTIYNIQITALAFDKRIIEIQ